MKADLSINVECSKDNCKCWFTEFKYDVIVENAYRNRSGSNSCSECRIGLAKEIKFSETRKKFEEKLVEINVARDNVQKLDMDFEKSKKQVNIGVKCFGKIIPIRRK